jgi:antitoxin (DNA-binding transcriptional repressor) of toxin-antitoxin stability system
MRSLREAQNRLPELVEEARAGVIGLTNEAGHLVGLLAGPTDDDLDDLLVETPAFQVMLARARASIQAGRLVPADEVLEEMTARLVREKAQQ